MNPFRAFYRTKIIVLLGLFIILGVCVGVTHYVMGMVDRSQAELEAARHSAEADDDIRAHR